MSKQAARLSKWTPSFPTPPRDNIISSQSRANNERGFTPSYESDIRPNMYCLLSDEYRRIWFRERGQYEKEVYTKKEMMKEESKIKRRFVQRCLVPKKNEKYVPTIKLKRFRNVRAVTQTKNKTPAKPPLSNPGIQQSIHISEHLGEQYDEGTDEVYHENQDQHNQENKNQQEQDNVADKSVNLA